MTDPVNTPATNDKTITDDAAKPKAAPKKASASKKPATKATASGSSRRVPEERMVQGARLTADEQHAQENGGKPFHKPAKTEGHQIALHDRVKLYTRNPINHAEASPAYVIGFNATTGNPNLRIEALTPGLATNPMEFGNVPQNKPLDPGGEYWVWPDGAGLAT